MKLKRAKAYKKLLHQYELNFGFHEPYQVLLDSEILQDADRFKIDLVARLEKVLGGTVKPMITTCDMRHLYLATPKNEPLILRAKTYERRRCNHHDLERPLSTLECLSSVVDPKDNHTNKHRYIVASNDGSVRAYFRSVAGVPLIYIAKSVVLMEPMADVTEEQRAREEKSKFKSGLKGQRKPDAGQKRKREETGVGGVERDLTELAAEETRALKKRRQRGTKQPNPLSVKKSKKVVPSSAAPVKRSQANTEAPAPNDGTLSSRRRKRKSKPKEDGGVLEAMDGALDSP